jgi:hypothetical protein
LRTEHAVPCVYAQFEIVGEVQRVPREREHTITRLSLTRVS